MADSSSTSEALPFLSKSFSLTQDTHRRLNPLTREWVLVSPHRTKRPWQGQEDKPAPDGSPEYDSCCYLCPGNARANGSLNPDYKEVYAFENDFAALLPNSLEGNVYIDDVLVAQSERGTCRVVCFSPRHNITLPQLPLLAVKSVVDVWTTQFKELSEQYYYVQIFENKGASMGCSNPHPHCQIWASQHLPQELAKEEQSLQQYAAQHTAPGQCSCLLCQVLLTELRIRQRIVCENEFFVAIVPFWAVWPFETLLLSRAHLPSLLEMGEEEKLGLADILRQVTIRYDNIFNTSFPYSMGLHQAPAVYSPQRDVWHFHIHFYPPLLRSATVRKFMVGYEMLATPGRDISPESSAALLREASSVHYLEPSTTT